MLQWMGGSRRKVTTSRRSVLKRQKQYFEQRKRQQQYQQQTASLESYADGVDISGQPHKEQRSLDVLSLLSLSATAQEWKFACPSDLEANASTMEYDSTNDSPVILSGTVVPANFIEFKEARIPSVLQVAPASPKKTSPSAPDTHNNVLNGVNSKADEWSTTSEQQLSVFDLLGDDGLNGNMEENPVREAHVAFSVEGLGTVGTETPVHSPQQPTRNFSYGFSSPLKAAGRPKLSKKFQSLLDDLEFEMDTMTQDINVPLSRDSMDFSSDIMDSLSSPKHKSYTIRDSREHDRCSNKRNSSFRDRYEDKWDDRPTFPCHSLFDERERDMSWKRGHSRIDDNSVDNLLYRSSNYDMSDFSFEDPRLSIRATDKVEDRFHVLDSTFSYSKHQRPEYDSDILVSNWARPPTVDKNFGFKPVTTQPDRFCYVTEDARDNSSLQSEESCSSSAVRYQASDHSLSNSTSRQGRRGDGSNAFGGSGNNYGVKKTFANENKDDCVRQNVTHGSRKRTNILNPSKSKPSHLSSSIFQENLETKDVCFFEEGYTTVDNQPGSSSFNQNSGTKVTHFDSELWEEDDPLSKFPTQKLHIGANPLCDEFNCEPVACSPSEFFTHKNIPLRASSIISKPEFPPVSELRTMPQDSSYTAGFQGETPSSELSPQESISKDAEYKEKFESFRGETETFELGKETCNRNENLVYEEEKENKVHEVSEAKYSVPQRMERVNKTFLPDPVEETSPSEDIIEKSGSIKDEKEDHHADKIPLPYKNGIKEREDFGPEGKMGNRQKSDYVDSANCQGMMLQSYVLQFFCVQKILK